MRRHFEKFRVCCDAFASVELACHYSSMFMNDTAGVSSDPENIEGDAVPKKLQYE
jgi:hypothetical protein